MSQHPGCPSSRRSALLALVAASGALVVPRVVWASSPRIGAMLGGYKHAGGQPERQQLAAAIEDIVGRMSFLVRGLARDRLRTANPVPSNLVLAADERHFVLSYRDERFVAPLDGSAVTVKSREGEAMSLRVALKERAVSQVFSTEGKSRENRFRLENGKLVIDVRVVADQLPKPLAYRLTYAKA